MSLAPIGCGPVYAGDPTLPCVKGNTLVFSASPGKPRATVHVGQRIFKKLKHLAHIVVAHLSGRSRRANKHVSSSAFAKDGPVARLESLGRQVRAAPYVSPEENSQRIRLAESQWSRLYAATSSVGTGLPSQDAISLLLQDCPDDTIGNLYRAMRQLESMPSALGGWRAALEDEIVVRFASRTNQLLRLYGGPLESSLSNARAAWAMKAGSATDGVTPDHELGNACRAMLVAMSDVDGAIAARWDGMIDHEPEWLPPPVGGEETRPRADAGQLKRVYHYVAVLDEGIKAAAEALAIPEASSGHLGEIREGVLLSMLRQCPTWQELTEANLALKRLMARDVLDAEEADYLEWD
ncbi:hypothetical protein CAL14_15565 [Bordetella genomosp. 9]|uniref:hypothetical protein n=1 Tax=Bordetella genomosp. 9 TaxID=1416803 RepID=UPI000A292B36|nr:hypothetical protein [Bordetella genomosp. 9]ARP91526.1 hypothetical protein CAL14_15565 [Bordetella genomosp. 9]